MLAHQDMLYAGNSGQISPREWHEQVLARLVAEDVSAEVSPASLREFADAMAQPISTRYPYSESQLKFRETVTADC